MKYTTIFILLFLMASCDKNVENETPIKPFPQEKVTKVSLEAEIEMLRNEVQGIREARIIKSLDEPEKTRFNNRITDLKKSLNKTISLIKTDYTHDQKRQLEASYAQTKEIWDYLIKNYKI